MARASVVRRIAESYLADLLNDGNGLEYDAIDAIVATLIRAADVAFQPRASLLVLTFPLEPEDGA